MKYLLKILFFCLSYTTIFTQDIYHSNLQNSLQTDYGLPLAEWVFHDNEAANLSSAFSYGNITVQNEVITDQAFSQRIAVDVLGGGTNPWDSGYGIRNLQPINGGDACLLVVWLKSTDGATVSLFVENSSTFDKEIFLNIEVPNEWTRFLLPFEADQNYTIDALTTGFHLAWEAQSFEFGGLTMLNYGTSVSVGDLPQEDQSDKYGGWEPDAPWRAEAANRIEEIRKANLTIRVETQDGTPIPDAIVEVKMLNHEYAFGSAVVSRLFAGNNSQNDTYESKILNLDGEGHGFNWVVFENALKWPGWEQNWISSKAETASAVQWLVDHEIKIRGHNILWPGWSNMPSDIQANQNNHNYFKDRMNGHIEEILTFPGIAGNIAEWDVLNEITTNRDLEMMFQGQSGYPTGREIYGEVFNKLSEIDPNTKTYINDYVTISQGNTGTGLYLLKKQFVQEIIDAGIQLDGIGFQGHIGASPTSIYDVQLILDDFYNTFKTTAKITEYDTNEGMNDNLAATYLRDFLTMVFSHESTDGFLTWGFWDGAHWKSNAPFFYQDWTLKPAGEAFIDLVFNEWWTEENGNTNADGEFTTRGFKGRYEVKIDCGNGSVVDTIDLTEDMVILKVDGIINNTLSEKLMDNEYHIYPNPAHDYLNIESKSFSNADVVIYDLNGRKVYTSKMTDSRLQIPLLFGSGTYKLVIQSAERIVFEKIIFAL